MQTLKTLFSEIHRRKVWLFASIYLGLAWLLFQIAIAVESTLSLPDWLDQVSLVLLALGFPAVLILAWAQDSKAASPATDAIHGAQATQGHAHGRPGLAVLPFDDFSDGQLHVGQIDGLVEDLTTMLGRNPDLKVVARNSAFQYRGQPADIQQACKALGADFAVEGSLRSRGDAVRLNIQLIEGKNGHHLWAETLDVPAADFEESLDDLVLKIAMRLTAEIARRGLPADKTAKAGAADAWTEFASGRAILSYKGYSAATVIEAEEHLRRAIKLDPDFAEALGLLALSMAFSHMIGVAPPDSERQTKVLALGQKALALAPSSSAVLGFVGCAYCDLGRHVEGVPLIERALEIDKANAQALAALGASKIVTRSDVAGGIADLERALSLIPDEAGNAVWRSALGSAYCSVGRYEEGLAMAQQAYREDPNYHGSRLVQIAALINLGREEDAAAIARMMEKGPGEISAVSISAAIGSKNLELIRECGIFQEIAVREPGP